MENEQITLDDITASVSQVLVSAQAAGPDLLGQIAASQQQRVAALRSVEARLTPQLGEDAPEVSVLRHALGAGDTLLEALNRIQQREAAAAAPDPLRWVVSGRIFDASGQPVPGLNVRITDTKHTLDGSLGAMVTDQDGYFRRAYQQQDFAAEGAAQPELQLVVQDAQGKELYTSSDIVHFRAGEADYFGIVVT